MSWRKNNLCLGSTSCRNWYRASIGCGVWAILGYILEGFLSPRRCSFIQDCCWSGGVQLQKCVHSYQVCCNDKYYPARWRVCMLRMQTMHVSSSKNHLFHVVARAVHVTGTSKYKLLVILKICSSGKVQQGLIYSTTSTVPVWTYATWLAENIVHIYTNSTIHACTILQSTVVLSARVPFRRYARDAKAGKPI